jgi:hypothetical protein
MLFLLSVPLFVVIQKSGAKKASPGECPPDQMGRLRHRDGQRTCDKWVGGVLLGQGG